MRPYLSSLHPVCSRSRVFFGLLLLTSVASGQSCTTTITGKVYSPNGVDPLPNILVYVPTTAVQPFPEGVNGCAAQSQLVSGSPLVSTTTAADGTFSLTNTGLAGTQTLVIQAGKWRRVYANAVTATACGVTPAPNLAMPQNKSQGDIPAIALSTGSSDALECVIRKIGISDSEFTAPGGGGRINLYAGSQAPGVTSDASGTVLPSETTLVSNSSKLSTYDMALFACQGTDTNPAAASTANQQNVVDFADNGGRVFATHYSYVWIDNSTVWANTAKWSLPDESISSSTTVPMNATIDQSYPEGKILAQWMYNVGATPTLGQLPLYVAKKDQNGVSGSTQSWATLNDPSFGNPVMQFTFDTPVSASGTPAVGVTFNNSPANYSAGDTSDQVLIHVTNNSATEADSTLNIALSLPPGLSAVSLAGANVGSGWACSTATLTCNRLRSATLAAGASDPVLLVVSVSANAPHGPAPISVSLGGGGLSGASQCGRVLYNEYHVETVSTGNPAFPLECTNTAMSAQEKFLEFSLYNLSNFVAPTTVDTAAVLGATTTTITGLASPIYYGQIIADTAVVAVSGAGTGGTVAVYIDGTLACTLTVTGASMSCPASTGAGYNAGQHSIYAVFSGNSQAAGSTSPTYPVTILPDATIAAVASSLNPSYLTQAVTFTATISAPYAVPVGQVGFLDNGVIIGAGQLNAAGVATFTTSSLTLGGHPITVSYPYSLNNMAMPNFLPSTGSLPTQTVLAQVVGNGAAGFTITVTPSPIVVPVYSSISAAIHVAEINGFSEPVNLSCSGLPNETTCQIGSDSIVGIHGGTVQILVTPTSPHACYAANNEPLLPFGTKGGTALAGVFGLGLFLVRKRKKLMGLMLLVAGLCVMPILQGCGGGCADLGTLPGTYSFTVRGVSSVTGVAQSVAVPLVVSVK